MKRRNFNKKDNVVFYYNGTKLIGVVKKVNVRSGNCLIKTPNAEFKIGFKEIFHLDLDSTLGNM